MQLLPNLIVGNIEGGLKPLWNHFGIHLLVFVIEHTCFVGIELIGRPLVVTLMFESHAVTPLLQLV